MSTLFQPRTAKKESNVPNSNSTIGMAIWVHDFSRGGHNFYKYIMSKIIGIFLIFFSLKDINPRADFLLFTFFIASIF